MTLAPTHVSTFGIDHQSMAAEEDTSQDDAAMSSSDVAAAISPGRVSSVDLVRTALSRIQAREHEVHAFAHLDPDWAIEQARQRDRFRAAGLLHGIPFAVKDVFDTADFPTEYNSPIYRGHRPSQDAECVARARTAGAVLIGKTVTSEFAHVVLGPTANPVNIRYSPGGSSSGSAAAIAAGFVPIALGTQTGGSVIRPASYCGVFGFKPTFGRLSVAGAKAVAPSLDTVGLFARNAQDLETFFRALTPATDFVQVRSSRRSIAVCRAEGWGLPDASAEAVLAWSVESLGTAGYDISILELPAHFDSLSASCLALLNAELARSLAGEYAHCRSQLSDETRQAIESGQAVTDAELGNAYELQRSSSAELDQLFENFNAILTFSARGEAPLGHANGDSVFNRVWTMLHVPCINIPAGRGPNRLPIGVQLIGRRGRDLELLALAREISGCIGRSASHAAVPRRAS